MHLHKKYLHKAGGILHCDTQTDRDRLLLHVSRNATGREQVGSPWSPRAMLSTYRVICINTDNFSHDSVRLILLQRMFSGPVTMDRNNVHHRQNKVLAFTLRSARFIYRIPTSAVHRFNEIPAHFEYLYSKHSVSGLHVLNRTRKTPVLKECWVSEQYRNGKIRSERKISLS